MAEYIGNCDVNHIPATASIIAVGGRREEVGGGGDGWGERLFSLSQPHLREKKRILVSFMYVPTNPGRADVSFEDN